MKKTVKNADLKALALKKDALTKVKGGTSSGFIIDDDISGFKNVAPSSPKKGFIIDDDFAGL